MSDAEGSYWDGQLWEYRGDVENDAAGASAITFTITIPVGSEAEILYGLVINQDVAGRTTNAQILESGGGLMADIFPELSLAAGARRPILALAVQNSGVGNMQRTIVGGGMTILVTVAAVALSQDAVFAVVMRIRGSVPTVVEAGGGTPVITIDTERTL